MPGAGSWTEFFGPGCRSGGTFLLCLRCQLDFRGVDLPAFVWKSSASEGLYMNCPGWGFVKRFCWPLRLITVLPPRKLFDLDLNLELDLSVLRLIFRKFSLFLCFIWAFVWEFLMRPFRLWILEGSFIDLLDFERCLLAEVVEVFDLL